MTDDLRRRIKVLSRYLQVPKGDIEYSDAQDYLDEEDSCNALFYVTEGTERRKYFVWESFEANDLLEETVEEDVRLRYYSDPKIRSMIQSYLDYYVHENCSYFDEVALEHAKEYIGTLSDEEYNQMAFDWGLLSEEEAFGDVELSWEEIYDLRDELREKQVEEWEIEYNGLKNWYIDTFGETGLYESFLGGNLNYGVRDLISDIISDYGFNYISCDDHYETVGDYYIIRVE